MSLTKSLITFGKYKGRDLRDLLRDPPYCEWLLEQPWFREQYEGLCNRIESYDPTARFFPVDRTDEKNALVPLKTSVREFLDNYKFFHLAPPEEVEPALSSVDETCYRFYLTLMSDLAARTAATEDSEKIPPFAIKAPTRWLKRFETEEKMPRTAFKEFLQSSQLPNITTVVEEIKRMGGIEYKGAKAFLIARDRSRKQEAFWEKLLKSKYGDEIGVQYKFEGVIPEAKEHAQDESIPSAAPGTAVSCFFDFVHIESGTLYECKLGLKDFCPEQYGKYRNVTDFDVVYLVAEDCIVDMTTETLWTTNVPLYTAYVAAVPDLRAPSWLDDMLCTYAIREVAGEGLIDYL